MWAGASSLGGTLLPGFSVFQEMGRKCTCRRDHAGNGTASPRFHCSHVIGSSNADGLRPIGRLVSAMTKCRNYLLTSVYQTVFRNVG